MFITIHTPTSNLESSLDFYTKLGFRKIYDNPTLCTDGRALIEINPDRYARAGIKLYTLNRGGNEIPILHLPQTKSTPIPDGQLLGDPSGVHIYIMQAVPPIQWKAEEKSFGVLGNFAGISLETTDLDRSASIYEALGFEKTGGSPDGGYVSYVQNDFAISLMKSLTCPHLFFNPSLTYFNGGNNIPVIEKIRALGIPITEEISYFNNKGIVDNIIIRDPGGYGFFVFND